MKVTDGRANKKFSNFLDHYLDQKVQEKGSRSAQWIKISLCIILYLGIMAFQASPNTSTDFNGILSQVQAVISIYLAINFIRTGFIVGLALNIANVLSTIMGIFIAHNSSAFTGMIVAFSTMISISIINILVRRAARQFSEEVKQKEELFLLNEELSASEEELRQQNDQLMESYEVIKKNEEKLNYLAYTDTLSELPNRKMILDRLDLLVTRSKENNSSFAVVFIDLDDFKKINDTMGHQLGDLLIVSVAARLNSMIFKNDLLGRLGGDEFALIIQQDLSDEDVFQYVENLREKLAERFYINQHEYRIRASFGISIYPQDGSTPDELIKCADTAMYKAKEIGKNDICFFRKEMRDEIFQKIDFENKLVAAIQNNEFFLVFQPQFITGTKMLRGFEALVRWRSPDWGLLLPLKFIPAAEEMGLIIQMGEWILRTACQEFKKIIDQYHLDAVLSVNISSIQFEDPSFVHIIKNVLQDWDLPANHLELEITESVLIKSIEGATQILTELKDMGVRVALDDFGTGYSSLRYLQALPIDTLKIDKSFVDSISNLRGNREMIGPIISLVHEMNVFVIAEGVESEIQFNYLKDEECDCIQGFLLGRPFDDNELQIFLDGYSNHIAGSLL
jgi:diguanylate cyclase (GGDEF)-like protein